MPVLAWKSSKSTSNIHKVQRLHKIEISQEKVKTNQVPASPLAKTSWSINLESLGPIDPTSGKLGPRDPGSFGSLGPT